MDLSHSMPQRLQNMVKKNKQTKNNNNKKKQSWCADYWTSEYMYVYSIEISCWNKVLIKRYSAWN